MRSLHPTRIALAAALIAATAPAQSDPPAGADSEVQAAAAAVRAGFDPRSGHPCTLPFAAMRDGGDHVQVKLVADGVWLRWRAIDGVPTDRIVAVCRVAFGDSWWKRLTEDLPQVVALMGTEFGDRVRLALEDPGTGAAFERAGVALTGDNRAAVKAAGYQAVPDAAAAAAVADVGGVDDIAREVAARFDPAAFPTTLPFTAMRQAAAGVEVRIEGDARWFRWQQIDGVAAARVAAVCHAAFGPRWWKRITEDLPQVLALMGHPVGDTVDLVLVDLDGGATVRRSAVPMSARNRRAVKQAGDAAAPAAPANLDAAAARADVEALAQLLRDRFSYAGLRGGELAEAVAALRRRVGGDPVSRADLALWVQECVAAAGDGHAGVRGWEGAAGGPWLPCLLEEVGGRFLALRPDRSGFLVPTHPYLVSLDGEAVEGWMQTAARLVARGSPQLVRRRSLRALREVQALRRLRGLGPTPVAAAVFAADDGSTVRRTLALADTRPIYGTWPRPRPTLHRELAPGIGYLRLASMTDDPALLDGIDAAMHALREADGVVVDVRGNGGGTRDALRRLLPYLLDERQPARVVNVATYRLGCVDEAAAARGEALADRGLYPRDRAEWSPAARAAIDVCAQSFRPRWRPPADAFGPWHYAVVERGDNARAFPFRGAVAVLIDHDCFSATDVFVGALRGLDRVQLVGRATAGGSGRGRSHALPNSGLEVRLSTMASFRPDGEPYDGRGIEPDVAVEPAPGDFVGAGDRVLDAAVAALRQARRR